MCATPKHMAKAHPSTNAPSVFPFAADDAQRKKRTKQAQNSRMFVPEIDVNEAFEYSSADSTFGSMRWTVRTAPQCAHFASIIEVNFSQEAHLTWISALQKGHCKASYSTGNSQKWHFTEHPAGWVVIG